MTDPSDWFTKCKSCGKEFIDNENFTRKCDDDYCEDCLTSRGRKCSICCGVDGVRKCYECRDYNMFKTNDPNSTDASIKKEEENRTQKIIDEIFSKDSVETYIKNNFTKEDLEVVESIKLKLLSVFIHSKPIDMIDAAVMSGYILKDISTKLQMNNLLK